MKVSLPITPDHVEKFLTAWGKEYEKSLKVVKDRLEADRRNSDTLSAIYNIYSRGASQNGSEIKAPRKIRVKAMEWAEARKEPDYNFLDMPDLVGITISVLFPADIQSIARHIDNLIQTEWHPAYGKKRKKKKAIKGPRSGQVRVETIYGEVHEDEAQGYYACHFYLRLREGDPIVEIQVKTVLHDAWGRKTHDLTYKNQVRIGDSIREQFASLGQMIARIDIQSDFVKSQIVLDNVALERKKRLVQINLLFHDIARNSDADSGMTRLVDELKSLSVAEPASLPKVKWASIYQEAHAMFHRSHNNSCLLLSLLAAVTNNAQVKMDALERIVMWEAHLHDSDDVVKPKLFYHLAHHTFGDTPSAIDEAEVAVKYVEQIKAKNADHAAQNLRRLNSLHNSLAYYHAELVGTDQGNKRKSHSQTMNHLSRCVKDLVARNVVKDESEFWNFTIQDVGSLVSTYPPLDTSLFVKIRLATNAQQVREAIDIMTVLKEQIPAGLTDIAASSLNLHQHHAYQKLLELEAADAVVRLA